MSDRPPPVEFYGQFLPPRVPTAQTKRAKQNIANRFFRDLLIRVGHTTLIDAAEGDERLRSLAKRREPEQQRRGRPRVEV